MQKQSERVRDWDLEKDGKLEIRFRNRESQAWKLWHHHGDTFCWMASRNGQVKRALLT